MGKRSRYNDANIRGGLGVRKRLSEESLRTSYRLNGVPTGSVVAKCRDRYGRWEGGYDLGVIVRKTASTVQIRWLGDEEITNYSQGDARYEVDRQRWRILGPLQGNPLDPNNPLVDALTRLRNDGRIQAMANASSTDRGEEDMAKEMSNAAAERAAAQAALKNGDVKDRDVYTAKQVALRLGTDAKTMRKFFRSNHSTVEPVGQGGRYEFDAKDLPKIKKEFAAWQKKSKARTPAQAVEKRLNQIDEAQVREAAKKASEEGDGEFTPEQIEDAIHDQMAQEEAEPTPEELAALEGIDLDDLDALDD